MAAVQIRVTMPYVTLLPQDIAINTWTIDTPGGVEAAIATAFRGFYASVSPWLGPILSREANICTIEGAAIDLVSGDLTPAAQIDTFTLAAPTGGTFQLPLEVAMCTSFAAAEGSGPPGRTRGRVFLGPLSVYALDSGDDWGRFDPDVLEVVRDATEQLAADLQTVDSNLCVWSRRAAAIFPVTHGWVDNEADTQRRRQVDASNRLVWSLAAP